MGRSSLTQNKVVLFFLLALAFALSIPPLQHYQVGTYIDDARFILRALALLKGSYTSLELPLNPPANIPLPGYPLLLAPFVAILSPLWDGLKFLSLLLTMGSVFLLWRLLAQANPWGRFAVVSLFALSPLTGRYASRVLAEPALIFFLLLFVDRFQRAKLRASAFYWVALGLGAGWFSLLRAEAILAVPILIWPLWQSRKRREGLVAGFLAVLVWGGVMIRNRLATESATDYLSQWSASWQSGSGVARALLDHWSRIVDGVLMLEVFGLRALPDSLAVEPLKLFLFAVTLLLMAFGCIDVWQSRRRDVARAQIVFFGLFYGGVHFFWLSFATHHFWPLLPALLILLISGGQRLARGYAALGRLGPPVFLIWLLLVVVAQVRAWNDPRIPLAQRTMGWMMAETSPDDIFFASEAPTLALYTKRFAYSAAVSGGADSFRFQLLSRQVSYALIRSFPTLSFAAALESPTYREGSEAQMARWLADSPKAFALAYGDAEEGACVYRLLPSPGFLQAFPIYQQGLNDLRQRDFPGGKLKLFEALKRDPALASAWGALGTTAILEGKPDVARVYLRKAIALRPRDPLLQLNLARALRNAGQVQSALQQYTSAILLLSQEGEFYSLRLLAEQEARDLSNTN